MPATRERPARLSDAEPQPESPSTEAGRPAPLRRAEPGYEPSGRDAAQREAREVLARSRARNDRDDRDRQDRLGRQVRDEHSVDRAREQYREPAGEPAPSAQARRRPEPPSARAAAERQARQALDRVRAQPDREDRAADRTVEETPHPDEARRAGEPVPPWRSRPAGDVPTGQLRLQRLLAEQRARESAERAAAERARAGELAAVLGTDASPSRRALAERWAGQQTAEQALGETYRHAAAERYAEQQRAQAHAEGRRLGEEAGRGRVALRLRGTSRAEMTARVADAWERARGWQAERDRAEVARGDALGTARRQAGVAAGHDLPPWSGADQVAAALVRSRAELTDLDLPRRAEQTDRRRYQLHVQRGDQAEGHAARWRARGADLGQERRLRDRMPAAQRDREDRERATDRHAERGRRAGPTQPAPHLDHGYLPEPDQGRGLER